MGGLSDGGGGGQGDGGSDDGESDSEGGVEVMASGVTTGMRWEWWKWQQQEEPQGGGSLFFPLDPCMTSFFPIKKQRPIAFSS